MDAADIKIDSTINKLADQYASCDRRSAEINDERATIRANVEKLGILPKAFVAAMSQVKQMSQGERTDYAISHARVIGAIGERQDELFPVEAERARKRAENAKPTGKEGAPDPDTNQKSAPKKSSSKVVPINGKPKPSPTAFTGMTSTPTPEENAKEQAEGAAILAQAPTNASVAGGAPGGLDEEQPPAPPDAPEELGEDQPTVAQQAPAAGSPWPDDLQAKKSQSQQAAERLTTAKLN